MGHRGHKKSFKVSLTEKLIELGHDPIETDGELISHNRYEEVARIVWQYAHGYDEKHIDDYGTETVVHHEPQKWAIQMVFDRIDGKAAPAQPVVDTVGQDKSLMNKLDAAQTENINGLIP